MRTRSMPVLALALILGTLMTPLRAVQPETDGPSLRVRIWAANVFTLRPALEAAGYDVLQSDPSTATIDLVVSRAELLVLEKSGYALTVLSEGRPLQEMLPADAPRARTTALAGAQAVAVTAAAVTGGYQNLDGILARMNEIALAFPHIAQVVDITATYNTPPTSEGRHLYALKISDNVALDEDEPAVLFVSNMHAREITTPLITLNAADRFTAGYDVDARITAAVNDHEIWIAPIWNPDGYNHVFTTDNMWRKNRRVFATGTGVDQNRNFPQGWSSSCAGSTSVASETYKGPSPASEPETQTMMTWSQSERFAKVIDYHSYGREVLYAYRCLSYPFKTWMQQEAAVLSTASGYGGHTRLPSAEGEHPEWQFSRMGAYAFLIETNTTFQPSYQSGLDEAAMVWPGMMTLIERPISVRGHVTDAATGAPLAAKVDIVSATFANGETNASGGPFGSYHMFLPAGTYDVRFSAQGYGAVVQRVTVTATSAATLDVQLSPETTVFADDFETAGGWTRNPDGTDTATSGVWERGDPQATSSNGAKQLGTTASGVNDLVTGPLAGTGSGSYDVDNGRTSIQSPPIPLPADGTLSLTFRYYFAHDLKSSSADYLRVVVVGATSSVVLEELGGANNDNGAWTTATVNLSAFAGQTIRIRVEAADAGTASLVEAGVDDVKITRR